MSDRGMKRFIQAALVAALATSLGFALVEGLTRLLFPAFDPSGRFAFDREIADLVLARPGTMARQVKNTGDYDVAVRINRHGLRDGKDIATARSEDLVVVGDSFAWGWGVEENERFSNLVEAMTGRRVFNISTPTDLDGYDALLAYGEALGARLGRIVVTVCMENDLRLYGPSTAMETTAPPARLADWKPWLESRSAAYLLATAAVHQTPWLRDAAVRAGLIVPNLAGIALNDDLPGIVDSSADRLQSIASRHPTLVVLIPSRALWIGANRAVEDRIHRTFTAALAERGVETLDLRPAFEAGGAPLSFHFANDGHWNPRGHRLAAEAITRRLGVN